MAKYAILIGVAEYFDKGSFCPLPCCYQDVVGIQKLVIDPDFLGYEPVNVIMMHDRVKEKERHFLPVEAQIDWAVNLLADRCKKGDTLLVYFSGHGCVKNDIAYIVAEDTRWDALGKPGKGVQLDRLRTIMDGCRATQKLMIIDACHSGESLSKAKMGLKDGKFHDALSEIAQGIVILSSCKKGELSWTDGDQSVFTGAILEGIKHKAVDKNGRVTIYSLAEHVGATVEKWAHRQSPPLCQTPTLYGIVQARGIVLYPPDHTTIPQSGVPNAGSVISFPMMRFRDQRSGMARPLIPLMLKKADNTGFHVLASIDSGADMCVAPNEILKIIGHNLDAPGVERSVIQGVVGSLTMQKHTVGVVIGSRNFTVDVYGTDNTQQFLLGQNFLSKFEVTLDYPHEQVRLRLPNK